MVVCSSPASLRLRARHLPHPSRGGGKFDVARRVRCALRRHLRKGEVERVFRCSKRPKLTVAGFLKHQGLATRKCETLVYTPRFLWRRLIKWHTEFVTTDCCARRSPEPP